MNSRFNQCTITLTRACNMRCSFCYAKMTGYQERDLLPLNDFERLVDFCAQEGIKNIVLTGGEPTMYPWLLDALGYVKSKDAGLIPSMASNGLLLANLDFCQSVVSSGLAYVDISLKGKDYVDSQMLAIRNLAQSQVEMTCSMVLSLDNIDDFCSVVRMAYQNGARQFSFTFKIDNSKTDKPEDEYLRDNNPFELVNAFMSHMDELNSISNDWWIEYSLPLCVFSDEQLKALENRLAAPCQVRRGTGVTFDTQMYRIMCNMTFDEKLGHFDKCSVRSSVMRDCSTPSPKCKACSLFERCMGGCPLTWKNYTFEALMNHKDCRLEDNEEPSQFSANMV